MVVPTINNSKTQMSQMSQIKPNIINPLQIPLGYRTRYPIEEHGPERAELYGCNDLCRDSCWQFLLHSLN